MFDRPMPTKWRRRAMLAASAAVALAATVIVAVNAQAAADNEHLSNRDFSTGPGAWYGYGGSGLTAASGALCYDSPGGGANPWDAGVGLNDLSLQTGASYTFSFDATASVARDVVANIQLDAPNSGAFSSVISLGPASQHFSFTFTWSQDDPDAANSADGGIAFQVGTGPAFTFCVDNVSIVGPSREQVVNGNFAAGTAPWWASAGLTPSTATGALCVDVPGPTTNPWDAIVGQDNIRLIDGQAYTLKFKASAVSTAPITIRVLAQNPITFNAPLDEHPALTSTLQDFSYTFVAHETLPNSSGTWGQVAFQIGGASAPWTFCVDDVSLSGGAPPPVYQPNTGPRVRVNQVAYLPKGPKDATLVTEATTALPWQLRNGANAVVASGTTTPRGMDATSGQNVHSIDFSSYTTGGTGFTLSADGETSHPFDIDAAAYEKLRLDALKFYYTQRSGTPIVDALRPGYGRPAGHVDVSPNQGDGAVGCNAFYPGTGTPGEAGCDYTLNVKGGWYDAGDHGKYVVNGGISVYQLMSEFERTKVAATAKAGKLGDSTLNLPESGNGVPDILDEARWQLEFLLSMQVPAGKPYAGMAHHKIHDDNWTGLPLLPHTDSQPRHLHKPSTAATLNLAAAAAQCARLFAPYDGAFADKCLLTARTAWSAAKANPAIYATTADGTGGGSYDDDYVADEFYWAAAELYISTGEKQFSDFILASPVHTSDVFRAEGFDWKWTGAIGRLELASIPNGLSGLSAVRASVLTGAEKYLAAMTAHPYGLPYAPPSGLFDWGSNNLVLNNMVVMATAFDLSGDLKFRDGVLEGMNYILGRNALNYSYVTGYGEQASQNQHSRWYSNQLNSALPHPPVGSLSGGPNSSIQDPKAQSILIGCKPQFCYVDHIDSWSTNELTINWNSTLAWVSAFIADQGDAAPVPPVTCKVDYGKLGLPGLFLAQIVITNTSNATVDGWTLSWAFIGDQKVLLALGADVTSSGATASARNIALNKLIKPRQSVTFGFLGSTSGANPEPGLFLLNGKACG